MLFGSGTKRELTRTTMGLATNGEIEGGALIGIQIAARQRGLVSFGSAGGDDLT